MFEGNQKLSQSATQRHSHPPPENLQNGGQFFTKTTAKNCFEIKDMVFNLADFCWIIFVFKFAYGKR
jgi:hypothetical protein